MVFNTTFVVYFQQYFSYIMAVSFICGGNRSTWRKPPTCRKSHNVVSSRSRLSGIRTLKVSGDR
jgi:hypothetical protein